MGASFWGMRTSEELAPMGRSSVACMRFRFRGPGQVLMPAGWLPVHVPLTANPTTKETRCDVRLPV
jgi:hypothetical protein